MNKQKIYTFEDHLKESLTDKKFKKDWQESNLEYQLSRKIIELRLKNKFSQSELAQKAETTQAIISKIESMSANPSIKTLKKIFKALNTNIEINFSI